MQFVAAVAVGEPSAQQPSYFTGGRPSVEDAGKWRVQKLKFPAGTRSNWHTHAAGQLLMVESGKARTQVRGQAVQEIGPGQPWWTDKNVEHWHGAAPDVDLLQMTIYDGDVKWLEAVTDAQYNAVKK